MIVLPLWGLRLMFGAAFDLSWLRVVALPPAILAGAGWLATLPLPTAGLTGRARRFGRRLLLHHLQGCRRGRTTG